MLTTAIAMAVAFSGARIVTITLFMVRLLVVLVVAQSTRPRSDYRGNPKSANECVGYRRSLIPCREFGLLGQSQRDCISQPKVAVLGYLGTSIAIAPQPQRCWALTINDETRRGTVNAITVHNPSELP